MKQQDWSKKLQKHDHPPIFLEWSLRRDVQYYLEAKEEDERVQELLKFLFFFTNRFIPLFSAICSR